MTVVRIAATFFAILFLGQPPTAPPTAIPAPVVARLAQSLAAAMPHAKSAWRDVPPFNADGTLNAYIEIARGDRRKWEFDIARNARAIDRVIPADPGGYPIAYGFVPQTISYDGDPFDVLVLGRPVAGRIVRVAIVGLMHMEDEKGLDSKVVGSVVDARRAPVERLTDDVRASVGRYFARYKLHEPGKLSTVPGWGTADEGAAFVRTTHAFFRECRGAASTACTVVVK